MSSLESIPKQAAICKGFHYHLSCSLTYGLYDGIVSLRNSGALDWLPERLGCVESGVQPHHSAGKMSLFPAPVEGAASTWEADARRRRQMGPTVRDIISQQKGGVKLMRMSEAIEEFLTSKRGLKPKTEGEYGRILGLFAEWCGGKDIALESLKAKSVGEYGRYLSTSLQSKKRGKVSTHTVAQHIRIVKIFLRWCSLDDDFEEYVEVRTVQKIDLPKQEQGIIETFSMEQIRALLVACDKEITPHLQQRNRALILLLLDTGIRAAELCGLHLDQVEVSPKDPHIRVFGKGDKWREVGLGERSRKEVWRYIVHYREADRGKHEPLFLGHGGGPLTFEGLSDSIERLGKRAGIEGVRCSPHTFRHTFAVTYMRSGGDIYRLKNLMGHTSIHITENYLKSFTRSDARRGSISPVDRAF